MKWPFSLRRNRYWVDEAARLSLENMRLRNRAQFFEDELRIAQQTNAELGQRVAVYMAQDEARERAREERNR